MRESGVSHRWLIPEARRYSGVLKIWELDAECCVHVQRCAHSYLCFKNWEKALAGVAEWVEHLPVKERSLVRFLVRAHAWAVGQVPIWGRVRYISCTLMFLFLSSSLSPSLLLSLKVNK